MIGSWKQVGLVGAALVAAAARAPAEDPWPFWGRTASRIGRTDTIGPQTPRIEWRIFIPDGHTGPSPVMDEEGRVFMPHWRGLIAIDARRRKVLWNFTDGGLTERSAAVSQGRVFWGDEYPGQAFYCFEASTGRELWRYPGRYMALSPVVGRDGIVYFRDGDNKRVIAARVSDGSIVATAQMRYYGYSALSLLEPDLLLADEDNWIVAMRPLDLTRRWTASVEREVFGYSPIDRMRGETRSRVYHASTSWYVYCFDAQTGQRIWRSAELSIMSGSAAIGHDGTIYAVTGGGKGVGRLAALSPVGEVLWEYYHQGGDIKPPIVDGLGTIYFASSHWTGREYLGKVHAVRPDGSELWARDMPPGRVDSSPMLAPDGTLYQMCGDGYLYAFKDPPRPTPPAEPEADITGRPGAGAGDALQRWRAELYEQWLNEDWGDAEPVDPPDAYLDMLEPQAP
jgi:outer membrane protein assembly factor BamB